MEMKRVSQGFGFGVEIWENLNLQQEEEERRQNEMEFGLDLNGEKSRKRKNGEWNEILCKVSSSSWFTPSPTLLFLLHFTSIELDGCSNREPLFLSLLTFPSRNIFRRNVASRIKSYISPDLLQLSGFNLK